MKQISDTYPFQSSNMKKIYLLFMLMWLLPTAASASLGYTVSPLVIDETVEARDIIERKITLTNTGTQPVTIYPTVNNISLKEGGTIDAFLPPVESDRTASLASWIEISRLGIDLMVGESHTINLTLRINPNPVAGTYHAFIGFGSGRNRDDSELQVKNGNAPGTVVSVTLDEKKNVLLKLSGFFVERFVTKIDNQAAVYTFKNPGDETLIPTGEIIFYDGTGKEVSALSVNDEHIAIPPGGEHSFVATVPTSGMFGKYKAFLSVEYGGTQKGSVQDTSFFYVFPLQKMLIILGIVLLITTCGAWYMHKKFMPDEIDDSEQLSFHIRETVSNPMHHDVDLKKK
jgi:hypothetical protein